MRILTVGNMYPPHHLGGYELMWRGAMRHLCQAGHQVRVLTTDFRLPELDPGEEDPDVHRELRWYWKDHDFPRLGLRGRLALERHNAGLLRRHLREFRPNAISWWAMGGMSLSLIEQARRGGLAAECVVVDEWPLYGPRVDAWMRLTRRTGVLAPVLERVTGIPARIDLERAATWLFASQTLRRWAESEGRRFADARIAYPGIDHDLFREPRGPRNDWHWSLLYCGRIDGRKGIDLAIEALERLPDDARLRIVGGGDEAELERLRRLASRLSHRVTFESVARGQLPQAYAEADATVFPVRWEEPFGLVPLESMAMGTPVVATGRGGSGEYLRDGENCLLFDPDRGPAALAEALQRLARDAELRRGLHAGGVATSRRFREEDFDRAVEAGLLEAVERTVPP